ncbi:uncharacterized protein LOC107705772 [Sinocyclocheilus rhinocerous]|uniref:uncharacterized protein LOC107705772 n=1 Tax=Sinocyclocheilus rhinocerous TaxID=307959 RepID=UPI0007BA2D8E|nr:PREDICTED: uncharacterized protein LOC107705772 [Sinocyclocheilus rhinocerous]
MEECFHLVCEAMGVHEDDEVGVDMICSLYKSVFLITAGLDETKRAIAQVRGQTGGLSCSARGVLHVLLVMEKQRENREELYWALQMLKAGRIDHKQNTQSSTINFSSRQQQDPEQFSILCLQNRAKRLYTRLVLDGVWSVLLSLSQKNTGIMRAGKICPSTTDILQLLDYKYEVIRERLYREMLQDEYGVVWWDSMSAWDQTECVCELGVCVELAFRHRDWLQVCGLPGALRCYRSCGSVVLQGCAESVKPRDQAWSSKSREQAWSAVIFLSELESHYQDEKESISALMNRLGREALRVIYLSMCVAVRRAEKENQSYTALLVARQHWDRWPYMRGSVSQDLARIWLQEKLDPTAKTQQGWKTGNCAQQERERTEQGQEEPSDGEKQELCTGCGMAIDPEDTPYLEILCVRDPRDEESTMETRDGDGERRQGHTESRGDPQVISVEKQNSLITLAWSKAAHAENHIQEVTSAQQEVEAVSIVVQEETADKTAPHDVNIYTQQENISSVSLQPSEQYEETHSDHTDSVKGKTQIQEDRSGFITVQERLAIVQSRKADEDLLGLTQEDTLRHLTDTLQQEDEQQQKTLVREKLQEMRRERSCILQTRRERNTAGFKELLAPTAQRTTETEEGH